MAFGGSPFGVMMGQSASGPLAAQRFRDPRFAYANALIQSGSETTPVQSPWQGIARLGSGLAGGWLAHDAMKEWDTREKDYAKAMADALKAGSGTPAVTQTSEDQSAYGGPGPETKTITPAVAADPQRMLAILGANRDAAPMATNFQLQTLAAQQAAAQQLANYKAMIPLKVEEQTALGPVEARNAGLKTGATAAAELPYVGPKAAAQAGATLPFDIQKAGGTEAARLAAQNAPTPYAGTNGPAIAPASAVADIAKAGPIAEAQASAQAPGKAFDRSNVLRDEYNTLTKDFRIVQDAYSKIRSTSDTGAGDMSLLYSYVKLLDPGSVVRESEFATAAASGALGERIQGLVQRIVTGERLPATLRESFKTEADAIYQAQKAGADRLRTQYSDLATRYNLKPEDVIQDYATAPSAPSGLPRPASPEDFAKLPSGTKFIAPDGSERIKP